MRFQRGDIASDLQAWKGSDQAIHAGHDSPDFVYCRLHRAVPIHSWLAAHRFEHLLCTSLLDAGPQDTASFEVGVGE